MSLRSCLMSGWKPLFWALIVLFVSSCKKDEEAQPKAVSDFILENNDFSILRAAVAYADISDQLKATNLTFFAPTNAAFQTSGYASEAALTALPVATVRNLLQYHILTGLVQPGDLTTTPKAASAANGGTVYVGLGTDTTLHINGARATAPSLTAANGIVYPIDRVLTPSVASVPDLIKAEGMILLPLIIQKAALANPTFAQLLNGTGTSPVTLFLPSEAALRTAGYTAEIINSASSQALATLLSYHAVSGLLFSYQLRTGTYTTLPPSSGKLTVTATNSTITVKGSNSRIAAATVTRPDLVVSNGVVHIIDQVLAQ